MHALLAGKKRKISVPIIESFENHRSPAFRHSGIPASVRGGLIFAAADVFKNLSNLFS
jgi:hypothetical protein